MAMNEVCKGHCMDYANATGLDIKTGDMVLVSKTLGVALTDIANGETGVLAIEGVYEIRKVNGALTQGDNGYWDADGDPQGATSENGLSGTGCLTATAQGNVYAGKFFAAAGATDTDVQLKLNV